LVDDDDRVSKGDLLVQLDREPYQVQVDLKKAAVVNAEVDVDAARAQVRGILAQARSQRWKLQRAIEDVDDKVAQLKARVAALRGREATRDLAKVDLARSTQLFNRGAVPREEFDQLTAVRADGAAVKGSRQVHEDGVPSASTTRGEGLTDVPADLQPDLRGQ
jgi:membrane fusion protein (multidrug efflux system)